MALGIAGCIVLTGTDLSGRPCGRPDLLQSRASLLQDRQRSRERSSRACRRSAGGWILLTILCVVLIGAIVGMVNGFFVAKFSLHPFIVTLATQLIAYGLILIFFMLNGNNGQPLSGLSQEYKNVISAPMIQFTTKSARRFPSRGTFCMRSSSYVIMWFIWNKTTFGKNMFAVGSNADAANVSPASTCFWTTVLVHTLAGAMYGVTGFIEGARISSITQSAGLNYECDAIAACVIGGVSFVGGTGKISGIVLGVFILRIIFVALSMLGINANMQYIIEGDARASRLDCQKSSAFLAGELAPRTRARIPARGGEKFHTCEVKYVWVGEAAG